MAARKRELIEPHKGDKRYVRRNKKGEFKEVVDVGRSLSASPQQVEDDRQGGTGRQGRSRACQEEGDEGQVEG